MAGGAAGRADPPDLRFAAEGQEQVAIAVQGQVLHRGAAVVGADPRQNHVPLEAFPIQGQDPRGPARRDRG